MSLRLRAGRLDDLDDIRTVCVRTGDVGRDATGTLPDVGVLPDLYAEPYLRLEPDLVTVVEDEAAGRVVGYVLGTADTETFVAAWRARWLPVVAARHPPPVPDPSGAYEQHVARLHRPEHLLSAWAATHPAHLHVDLLPSAQGRGLGRALIEQFCVGAARAGATGVHLVVDARNTAALAFYGRVGFEELGRPRGSVVFGRRLQHAPTRPLGRCPAGC
ncbi:GNAT family N-acetyltransferase [Egicoccus sp. AB-alg6-2]|uniref:GNAT family N-acetyltransferase n=1 Tax=Egicoccus sp. AB-alg6-2 TaxID=3242692 RepID=UPI00359CE749